MSYCHHRQVSNKQRPSISIADVPSSKPTRPIHSNSVPFRSILILIVRNAAMLSFRSVNLEHRIMKQHSFAWISFIFTWLTYLLVAEFDRTITNMHSYSKKGEDPFRIIINNNDIIASTIEYWRRRSDADPFEHMDASTMDGLRASWKNHHEWWLHVLSSTINQR